MATPTGALLGSCMNPLLPWLGISTGLVTQTFKDLWRRYKTPTSTKYGITNEKRSNTKTISGLYKRRRRYRLYKWINNGYRYKKDFLIELYVKDQGNSATMKQIGTTSENDVKMNVLNVFDTEVAKFRELFDQYHMCGVVVQFKPYQIVKVDSNAGNNQTPNLLFTIMTRMEFINFGTIYQDADTLQKLTDRPFTRIIAADDDMRIYRPFKIKPDYDVDDELLYSWVPTAEQPRELYLVCLLAPGYGAVRANQWNIGTIKLTLYYKFKNSKL